MTYELYNKKNNKEAWKTYVNFTPPGVFTTWFALESEISIYAPVLTLLFV